MFRLLIFGVLVLLVFVESTAASKCEAVYEDTVSEADIKIITDKHNELRQLISTGSVPGQPKGINLKHIKYDKNLARAAQQISNTCDFKHRTVKDDRWWHVGQNLYISMSTGFKKGANWTEAIQAWFDEYKDYTYGGRFSSKTGHYTQVVWADTEYVGCGYTYFTKDEFYKYQKLYTCNYGPGGNIVGKVPYQLE